MDYEVDTFSEKFNWANKKQIPPSANSLNGIECFLIVFNSLDRFWKSKFDFCLGNLDNRFG